MAVPRSTEPITVSAQADEENLVAELNETNNLDEQSLNLVVTGL
jgi:subtilase family serine protease